jgi:hypothetical protein
MNCKESRRKRSWPSLRYYLGICLKGRSKSLSHDIVSPGRLCLFNNTVNISGYIASKVRMCNEEWMGNNVDRSGRGIIWGTILRVPGETEEILKISIRIVGVAADIPTRHLQNASQMHYHLIQPARSRIRNGCATHSIAKFWWSELLWIGLWFMVYLTVLSVTMTA